MRHVPRTLLVVLAALALSACGSDDIEVEVSMLDNTFVPGVIEVPVNGTVLFRNDGRNPHNAIDVAGTFSTEDTFGTLAMEEGDGTTLRFQKAGVYEIFCSFHATRNDDGTYSGMTATVVVGEAEMAEAADAARADVPTEWTGVTRRVPTEYPTIQSAVDAADPGDLILIAPGTYKEQVTVTTPSLTVRGEDRNAVILDGEHIRENGVFATADGVAVENLTTKNFTSNGVFWTGITGYRGSYLTAIDNGVYGIYAFDSVDGLIEHSYASGSWDAGFYIGQCDPCNAVITDVVAEYNGLGYSGTNSSGNIYIVNSVWRYNSGGIVPNTLDSELLPPVHDVVVAGNYVHDQGTVVVPAGTVQRTAEGHGIVIPGGLNSIVANNLVADNTGYGIAIAPMFDANFWPSGGHEIRGNTVLNSGLADLVLSGPAESGSCFADNEYERSIPRSLGLLHDCDGINLPRRVSLGTFSQLAGGFANGNTSENPLAPGEGPGPAALDFDQLPGGSDAPVRPAVQVFAGLDTDLGGFLLPTDVPVIDGDRQVLIGSVPFPGTMWTTLFGVLLDWVPKLVWVIGGLWAIMKLRRRDGATRFGWIAAIVVVPVLGLATWTLVAHQASLARRLLLVFGTSGAWLAALVAALVAGGLV